MPHWTFKINTQTLIEIPIFCSYACLNHVLWTGLRSPGFRKDWWVKLSQTLSGMNILLVFTFNTSCAKMWGRFSIATQELYEKSLVRVEDGSLSAELLEIKSFLSVPQVNSHKPQRSFCCDCRSDVHFTPCLVIGFTVFRTWWRSWRYVRGTIWWV